MADVRADSLRGVRTLLQFGALGLGSDGELLDRFARRDGEEAEAAFEALVERHGPMVLGVCRRVLGDPHDAQDAFQATFLVLARNAGRIARPELLGNWLYGVATRTAKKARTGEARRRKHERRGAARTDEESLPDEESRELLAVLHEEIARLPDKYRVPVVLCHLEGMSRQGASAQLRCPENTLGVRLMRARERLRAGLARRGFAVSEYAFVPCLSLESTSPPVSTALRESTVRIASGTAKGGATCPEVISARIFALSKGVLLTMSISKTKHIVISLSLAASFATGAILLARQPAAIAETPTAKPPAPRRADAQKPLPANAPNHGPKTDQSSWKRSLPNGVTVALLGVTSRSSSLAEGLQWTPEGSRIAHSLDVLASGPHRQDEDKKVRAFVIRVTSPEAPEGVHIEWEFPGAIVSDAGRCVYHGKDVPNGYGAIVQVPRRWSSCTARIGVAAGPWTTAATGRGLEEREKVTFGPHIITFSRALANGQGTSITIGGTLKSLDTRLVALDRGGQLHEPIDTPSGRERPDRSTMYRFRIAPDRIQEFRLQTRTYERVEFRDIPLEPRTIDDAWPVERLRLKRDNY